MQLYCAHCSNISIKHDYTVNCHVFICHATQMHYDQGYVELKNIGQAASVSNDFILEGNSQYWSGIWSSMAGSVCRGWSFIACIQIWCVCG